MIRHMSGKTDNLKHKHRIEMLKTEMEANMNALQTRMEKMQTDNVAAIRKTVSENGRTIERLRTGMAQQS